jgi:hypothetical protein
MLTVGHGLRPRGEKKLAPKKTACLWPRLILAMRRVAVLPRLCLSGHTRVFGEVRVSSPAA